MAFEPVPQPRRSFGLDLFRYSGRIDLVLLAAAAGSYSTWAAGSDDLFRYGRAEGLLSQAMVLPVLLGLLLAAGALVFAAEAYAGPRLASPQRQAARCFLKLLSHLGVTTGLVQAAQCCLYLSSNSNSGAGSAMIFLPLLGLATLQMVRLCAFLPRLLRGIEVYDRDLLSEA